LGYDVTSCLCDETDVVFDDYLDLITLPIFYIGAAGGTGSSGEFTLTLTASNDLKSHIVTLAPADATHRDFGHAGLFMSEQATNLVWDPLRIWLQQHQD
jgi:hypothetical protein